MSELLEVFEAGDRFATITADGVVVVWVVAPDGTVKQAYDIRRDDERR